jgi:hypothetical protein
MKEIMYVIRRPDGRYYSRVNPNGVLLPEDAAIYGMERVAEYDLRSMSFGHQIFEMDQAPLPPMTLIAKDEYFARAVPTCSVPGVNVHWVDMEHATRWTEDGVAVVLRMHPGSHPVTDEEAQAIECARIAREGVEYQYEQAHGL